MPDESSSASRPSVPDAHDTSSEPNHPPEPPVDRPQQPESASHHAQALPREYGGRSGPDPVRYGDWEKGGRCIDF